VQVMVLLRSVESGHDFAVFVTNRGTAMLLLPSMSLTETPPHAGSLRCDRDYDICSAE